MTRGTILVAANLLAACGIAASVIHFPQARNLVIVTLDTTRADRLPTYGFSGVTTTVLDGLAREGVVFEHAESVAPLTLTAHTSIFTGLYPPRHGVRDNLAAPLDASHATLAGILHAHAFRTAAFVGSAVLRRDRGLARGFDVYDDGSSTIECVPRRRSAADVVDAARASIANRDDAPFFLWVHLYDAHAPQRLPIEFRRAYGDNYEGAIAYVDSQIGRVMDALREKRLLDSTAILIAGDHGESLGEHGEREHGIFLYESTLHVPMVLRTPGLGAWRVPDLVSLVDVFPTVLAVLRIASGVSGDGRSLLAAARGEPLSERPIYAESMYATRFGWSPLRMLRDGRLKFVDAPRPELYDLAADPFERHNLVVERVAAATSMRADMAHIAREAEPQRVADLHPTMDVLRQLAGLGYVAGGPSRMLAAGSRDLDPKDYIKVYNAMREHSAR